MSTLTMELLSAFDAAKALDKAVASNRRDPDLIALLCRDVRVALVKAENHLNRDYRNKEATHVRAAAE